MTANPRSLFEYLKNEAERPFLMKALNGGLDDLARLDYANVLDSRDPERAEWLRLEVRLNSQATSDVAIHKRFRELSRAVGYDFHRLMRRGDVLNCGRAIEEPRRIRFTFICDKRWETLLPTENANERHCDACNMRVHHCATVNDAQAHVMAGHCIAVSHTLVENAAGGGYRNAVGRPDPLQDWANILFPAE